MYRDIGGFDMKNDEFKEMSRKIWSEKFHYLRIDISGKKKENIYRFFNESKNTFTESIPKSEGF